MVTIGTPLSPRATKVVLCGSGELGKEFVIELQRYGVEVIALDKYANAPAMQVAHRSYVVSMLDGAALRAIIEQEKPDYIVPEVEAIATTTLMELEQEGYICTVPGKGSFACARTDVDEERKSALLHQFDETVGELLYLGVSPAVLCARIRKGEEPHD